MQFKYKIGDFVTPIVSSGYEHATKMVIFARVTEERAQHVERYYICSHYKLGEYVRSRVDDSEITAFKE